MVWWPRRRGGGTATGTATGAASGAAAEGKASRAGPLIAWAGHGRAQWTPRNYAALAREGFCQNAIAYRCVRMVAEGAASVPLLLYEGIREHDAHPLLDLLARPNPFESGPALLEAVYGHLLIAGNAYIEAVEAGGAVRELHALRPDRMRVVAGPQGWPAGYEYSVDGRTARFDSDPGRGVRPVLHLKLFHPTEDHYGLSPIEAAAMAIDTHNAAAAWNKALLDNAARPSGALVYAGAEGPANLTEPQFARLKRELQETYQGARNAGRPMLLDGGLDWKPMALSPADMQAAAQKDGAAREIALAFGVPPMLLGIPGDNTYANYAEANRAFWRQTVLPLVGRSCAALTGWLGPRFGAGLRLGFDADRIEALSADRAELWRRVGAADFLTEDEKREAVGYGARGRGAA